MTFWDFPAQIAYSHPLPIFLLGLLYFSCWWFLVYCRYPLLVSFRHLSSVSLSQLTLSFVEHRSLILTNNFIRHTNFIIIFRNLYIYQAGGCRRTGSNFKGIKLKSSTWHRERLWEIIHDSTDKWQKPNSNLSKQKKGFIGRILITHRIKGIWVAETWIRSQGSVPWGFFHSVFSHPSSSGLNLKLLILQSLKKKKKRRFLSFPCRRFEEWTPVDTGWSHAHS